MHSFGIIQIRNNDQDHSDSSVSYCSVFHDPPLQIISKECSYHLDMVYFLGQQCSLKTHANKPLMSLRYPFLEMF